MKVYLFDVSGINMEYVKDHLSCLSDTRVAKIEKMKQEKDKLLSFAAGMTLDEALKDFGYIEKDMKYLYSEKGKPYLSVKDRELYFNLSHSGSVAAAVVAENEIGIDIEHIRDYSEAIVKRCFSLRERKLLAKSEDKLKSFYGMWTMKEAYVKLTGQGITFDMSLIDTSAIYQNEKIRKITVVKSKDATNNLQEMGAMGKIIYDIEGYVMSVSTYELIENVELIWINPMRM